VCGSSVTRRSDGCRAPAYDSFPERKRVKLDPAN
jgi:hypothetical protein